MYKTKGHVNKRSFRGKFIAWFQITHSLALNFTGHWFTGAKIKGNIFDPEVGPLQIKLP